jgi:hypothetical protein
MGIGSCVGAPEEASRIEADKARLKHNSFVTFPQDRSREENHRRDYQAHDDVNNLKISTHPLWE